MILENTVKQASKLLKYHQIFSHELDAQVILSDIMGVTKEFLIVNNQMNLSKKITKKYNFRRSHRGVETDRTVRTVHTVRVRHNDPIQTQRSAGPRTPTPSWRRL